MADDRLKGRGGALIGEWVGKGGTERPARPRSQFPAKGAIIAWRLTLPEQLKIKEDKPNITRRRTVYD